MSLISLAKILILAGIVLLMVGAGLYFAARFGLPLGRLPGDIVIRKGNTTISIPIATSILLSLIGTILINLILRFFDK